MTPPSTNSDSPFGTGFDGAMEALKTALKEHKPTRDQLTDERLRHYTSIALNALDEKIGDRAKAIGGRNVTHGDIAWLTLIDQGSRLLVLEQIIKNRGAQPMPRMNEWLSVVKSIPWIVDNLRKHQIDVRML